MAVVNPCEIFLYLMAFFCDFILTIGLLQFTNQFLRTSLQKAQLAADKCKSYLEILSHAANL